MLEKIRANVLKVLANEDTLLPTQMFPCLPVRATFVADTNFVSRTRFSKLPVIAGPVKLFCFPFHMGVSIKLFSAC